METADLLSLVEHLEDNIDDLEENLEPLLSAALSATTKKLPVLDKAKLYVLIVYSIESLLFSYLRLNGVQAKEHPVFKELTRVKQYFEKVKVAENGPMKPRENMSLNKQATGRVIKHALAGNDKYDLERAERLAKEKAIANRRLRMLTSEIHQKTKQAEEGGERMVAEAQAESESESSSDEEEEGEVEDEDEEMVEAVVAPSEAQVVSTEPTPKPRQHQKGRRRNSKKEKKQSSAIDQPDVTATAKSKRNKKKRLNKRLKSAPGNSGPLARHATRGTAIA